MTAKTLTATKIQQNNEPSKFITFNHKDFRKACEIIKTWQFSDYDLNENWFSLIYDTEDRSWAVQEHCNQYWLFIDDEAIIPPL